MSQVYFSPGGSDEPTARTTQRIEALWQRAGLDEVFQPNDLTAVKLHVGEPGTRSFVRPTIVAALVAQLERRDALPFLTDTAVLYKSPRDNAVSHALVAHRHGFGIDAVGAPFIPADGLRGSDETEVEIEGRHYQTVAIATTILQARSLLLLSHATGHLGTGFGGALKNLGMGCSAKKAKLRQHHGQQPRIDPELCTACGTCASWCPSDAITVTGSAAIDPAVCIGCGECIAACREAAVEFDWGIMGTELQERIVEHAAAVVRRQRDHLACVTVAQDITKDCDCLGLDQPAVVPDLGILVSRDPVALDLAVLKLIEERVGRSLESLTYPRHDGQVQIRYAAAMGLGEAEFELIEV